MSFPPERVETDRLLLRHPLGEDAEKIFVGYATDPEVTRYLLWKPHTSINDTADFLARCYFMIREKIAFPFSITMKDTGEMVGMTEMRISGNRIDIGYVLGKKHWNRGMMTEAVRQLIVEGFQEPTIFRVGATCHTENIASARVLEKAGMTREGTLRRYSLFPNLGPIPADVYSYAITK
ncbi:MAG TPA: GNAT family N-acetyltransferase [Bacteroidota bacterium]|jgi:RimJ/RimL family protein N-acetyltransferase